MIVILKDNFSFHHMALDLSFIGYKIFMANTSSIVTTNWLWWSNNTKIINQVDYDDPLIPKKFYPKMEWAMRDFYVKVRRFAPVRFYKKNRIICIRKHNKFILLNFDQNS